MKKFQTYFSKAKLIIPFCLFSLFFVRSFSQELILYEEPLTSRMEKSKQVVQNSVFIFQGKFISESVQHTADPNLSIIKTIFQVQYVYKGNLKMGRVMVEREAPVPHWVTEKFIGNDGKEYEMEKGYGFVSHSRSNRFSLTKSAIFFCKLSESTQHSNDSIENKQILEYADAQYATADFDYYDAKSNMYDVGGLVNLLFKVKADFHKFLQESDSNIVLPLTGRAKAIQDSILYQPQRERHKKFTDSVYKRMLKRCINY